MSDKTYEIPFDELIVDGDKAWLLRLEWIDDNFTMWIPKSFGEIDMADKTMVVPWWLMRKKAEEHDIQEFYEILEGNY